MDHPRSSTLPPRAAQTRNVLPGIATFAILASLMVFGAGGCSTIDEALVQPYNTGRNVDVVALFEKAPIEVEISDIEPGRRDLDGTQHSGSFTFVVTNTSERNVYGWEVDIERLDGDSKPLAARWEQQRVSPPQDRTRVVLAPDESRTYTSSGWTYKFKKTGSICVHSVWFLDPDSEDYEYEQWEPSGHADPDCR